MESKDFMYEKPRDLSSIHNDLYREGIALIGPYLVLSDAPAKDPSSPSAQKELKRGITLLRRAVDLYPDNWEAFWVMGKGYQALRQREDAYQCFQRAYSINPNNPDVGLEYVAECIAIGKGDEAVEIARGISEGNPNDVGLLSNLGLAYLIAGNVDKALEVTRKAMEMQPEDSVIKNLLSLIQNVQEGKIERPTKWSDF